MEECVICFTTMNDKDFIQLSCNHRFHGRCLQKWLKYNATCPLCREKQIVEDRNVTIPLFLTITCTLMIKSIHDHNEISTCICLGVFVCHKNHVILKFYSCLATLHALSCVLLQLNKEFESTIQFHDFGIHIVLLIYSFLLFYYSEIIRKL